MMVFHNYVKHYKTLKIYLIKLQKEKKEMTQIQNIIKPKPKEKQRNKPWQPSTSDLINCACKLRTFNSSSGNSRYEGWL